MKIAHLILAAVVGAIVTLGGVYALKSAPQRSSPAQPAPAKETRWEQIKRTGVLRCGYVIWPPALTKEPNTGKIGGLFYDLAEEIGKQLNLKIDWVAEVAPGQMFSDLSINRYDMICSAFYVTPGRAREGFYTSPILFWPTYLYARQDDARFDNDYAKANAPDVTFSIQDGDFSSIAAREHFPKAATSSIPQIASSAELFVQVASKKADIVIVEPLTYMEYAKKNPGMIRQVKGSPIFAGAVSMPLPANEIDMKVAIDGTLLYLQMAGILDNILKKYETPDLKFLHLAKPYSENNGAAP